MKRLLSVSLFFISIGCFSITYAQEVLIAPERPPIVTRERSGIVTYSPPPPIPEAQKINESAIRELMKDFLIKQNLVQKKTSHPAENVYDTVRIISVASDKDGRVSVYISQTYPTQGSLLAKGPSTGNEKRIIVLPKNITAQNIKDAAAVILEKKAAVLEEEAKKTQEKADALRGHANKLKKEPVAQPKILILDPSIKVPLPTPLPLIPSDKPKKDFNPIPY